MEHSAYKVLGDVCLTSGQIKIIIDATWTMEEFDRTVLRIESRLLEQCEHRRVETSHSNSQPLELLSICQRQHVQKAVGYEQPLLFAKEYSFSIALTSGVRLENSDLTVEYSTWISTLLKRLLAPIHSLT